jgi:transposase
MIDEELRARIRRLFFAEHWRVGTIATELGLHHDTVERAIGTEHFALKPKTIRPSILDPYKGLITQTLEEHPRLRATRLLEMVKARGYPGGIAVLRRFVRKIRPRRAEAFFRLQTLPGEQAQVDWGSFGKVTVGHARRSLSCFVMVLSYSRAIFARFYYDQALESFLSGHVAAFEAFGGVPRQLLYDNLKSVVLERVGDHVRYHPQLLELAGHYHFAPQPCAPYRGNEKGKVERTIQYIRSSFYAARDYQDIDDLNAQLQQWIETVAHLRKVPADPDRRLVLDALDQERDRLLPLPQHPFSCSTVHAVRVGKYPYVRFDLNDYSVPHDRVGQTLTLIATPEVVRIVDNETGEELADHLRYYDRGMCVEDRRHVAELAEKKRRARELRGRDRLRQACGNADAFIEALAVRNVPLSPQTSRLLRLLDRYGADELNTALAEALERQALSAASVAHILDQRTRARRLPPPLEVVLPDDDRVRDLHLTPHALAPYDSLASYKEQDDDDKPR